MKPASLTTSPTKMGVETALSKLIKRKGRTVVNTPSPHPTLWPSINIAWLIPLMYYVKLKQHVPHVIFFFFLLAL